jgi:hypothetical protein
MYLYKTGPVMLLITGCTSFYIVEWKLICMMWISCASVSVALCFHMSVQIQPEICETQDQVVHHEPTEDDNCRNCFHMPIFCALQLCNTDISFKTCVSGQINTKSGCLEGTINISQFLQLLGWGLVSEITP